MLNKNLLMVCWLFALMIAVPLGSAINVEQGGIVDTSINTESRSGVLNCYSNTTHFDVWCFASSATVLDILVDVTTDQPVGNYPTYILLDRAYDDGGNYTTETNVYITTLDVNVTTPVEDEPEEEVDEECEITISVIGRAFYGKNLLIHTTDENYKDIIANVVGQDGAGNSLICQTNNPFKGYCNIFIPEDSEPDITLLANQEGCTTGQYIINRLEGQKLTQEEEEESNKTLEIVGLPDEALINSMVNGTVLVVETGEVIDGAEISITNPLNAKLTTHSSNGLFKFFGGEIGSYVVHAKLDGHTQSQNYTITIRHPRKSVDVVIQRDGATLDYLYVGDTVDLLLYCDNTLTNGSVLGTVKSDTNSAPIAFISGIASYEVVEEGIVTVTVDKSDLYLEATIEYEAYPCEDYTLIVLIIAVIVFVLIIVIWLARRGGGTPPFTDPDESMETDGIKFID